LVKTLLANEKLATSIENKAKIGMYYAWLGFALEVYGKPQESYKYLYMALTIAEDTKDQLLLGFTNAWLAWACMDLGNLDEGVCHGEKALEIGQSFESEHHIYFFSKALNAIGQISYFTGNKSKAAEAGDLLIECGENKSNIRSQTLGYICAGLGHTLDGNFSSAIKAFNNADSLTADPVYSHYAKLFIAICHIQTGKLLEAEKILQTVVTFSKNLGFEIVGSPAEVYLAVIQIAKGKMQHGLNIVKESLRDAERNGKRSVVALFEYILGKVYLQMIGGNKSIDWTIIAKNIGFLAQTLPFASKKAEKHLNQAIKIATEIGGNFIRAQAYLDLSILHKTKKRKQQAKECILKSIKIFEKCEAETYLKQARDVFASLN
jgi:tetratricopeptide (TPR) repeat protein